MKKITFLVAVILSALFLNAGNPSWTRVWELSASLGTNPSFVGTANNVRGMGIGTFQGEKVVVIPTREGGNAVKVLKASDGSDYANLNVTGVSGGAIVISDAAVTNDGKILVSNVVNAASSIFKIYRWDNTTDAPTVAISYTLTAAYRLGDHITVKGSISDGTAKVYVVSGSLVSGVAPVFRFDMISDGNGGYVFNSTPVIISSAITATATYASMDLLPDGSFINKYNGSQIRKYNADGTYASQESASSIVGSGGNSVRYLLTKTAETVGNPDTAYVAYFRYGTGQERANIVKFPNSQLNSAATEVAVYLPTLGTNANGNGVGRVAVDVNESDVFVYVFSTNNGIGKYKITWPTISTGVKNGNSQQISVYASQSILHIQGIDAPDVEIYSIDGQVVRHAISNTISAEGLKGIYVVKVHKDGLVLSTTKISF